MNRAKIYICLLLGWIWCTGIQAQESFQFKVRSRALIDAAVSGYGKESTQGYYRLEDFRIGVKATYGSHYEIKADIGLGGGKVAIKDLLFNLHSGVHTLSLGNGYEPFSMDMLISTADLRFNQSATATLAYTDSRKLGATYYLHTDHLLWCSGIYTHNDINKLGEGQKNALVTTGRLVWRNLHPDTQRRIHLGGAFSYRTKEVNTAYPPEGSISSDGVTSLFGKPLLEISFPNMGSEVKGLLEGLYTAPRWMLQAEYFFSRMNRTEGAPAYRSHGGYIQGGFLLKGKGFEYDKVYGVPGRPSSPQAIELVARFNYTDMNDERAGLWGGEEKDLSLGVNFYLNPYIGIKINGSYVWVGEHCHTFYQKNLLLFQTRLQYIF